MTLRWLSRLTPTDPSGLVGASKLMDKPLGKGHSWQLWKFDFCQEFGDELINRPAESIPRVALSEVEWLNFEDNPLVMAEAERAQSSGPAMSAMMAILKLFQDR